MRRFLLAAIIFVGASGAHAADLPDFPALRGTYTDVPSSTRINWQGYYIGVQGGYGSSDETFRGSSPSIMRALLADTLIGREMSVSEPNLGLGKATARTSGFGGFVGYNSQWDDVVVGIEASYLHGGFGGLISKSEPTVSPAALSDGNFHRVTATSTAAIAVKDMASFRARAGYAYGCFLPYMFGGFALGNADITRTVTVQDAVSLTALGPFTALAPLRAPEGVHNHLIYGHSAGLVVDAHLMVVQFVGA